MIRPVTLHLATPNAKGVADKSIASAGGVRVPQHLEQQKNRSSTFTHCHLEAQDGWVWSDVRHGKYRDTKGSATLGIAALGMALAYLLLVAAGTIGMLLGLLWLFQDTPVTTEKIGREKIEGSRSAERLGREGKSSASVEHERWEDEAA
jgi:hypothetical protein